ncbi:MAG: hypothetical protein NVS3B20_12680 [Polyangiales bacterium]
MQTLPEQRPLGELFGELVHETGTLIRKEVDLAKVEMSAKAKTAARHAASAAIGGAVALAGALTLLAALVLVIATAIPLWASALLVGLAVTTAGGLIVLRAVRAFQKFDVVPRATVQTLQEDRQWAKEQMSR